MAGCSAGLSSAITACSMLAGMIINYIIAVAHDHVASIWPYISDTGVKHPELSFFSLLLSLTAFAGVHALLTRYLINLELTKHGERSTYFKRFSLATCILGCVSLAGLVIVGNFQEDYWANWPYVHDIGGGLLFGCASVYCLLETVITFQLPESRRPKLTRGILRALITGLLVIFSALFLAGKFESEKEWDAGLPGVNVNYQMHWNESEPGYSLHILGTTSEWIAGLMIILYLFTFAQEFHKYSISMVVRGFIEDHVDGLRRIEEGQADGGQIHQDVGGAGRIHQDVGGAGRVHQDVGGAGRVHQDVDGAGRVHQDVGGAGRVHQDVGGAGQAPLDERSRVPQNVDDVGIGEEDGANRDCLVDERNAEFDEENHRQNLI